MKSKVIVLGGLAVLLVVFVVQQHGGAAEKAAKPSLNIGFVNIQRVFKDCDRAVKYRQQATAERDRIAAELDKLDKEIQADKAGLKTLKTGSSDYMERLKTLLEKQASLQAKEELYKQQIGLKEQRLTEDIYTDLLKITGVVAESKGLAMVLVKDEPELPAQNYNEFVLTMRTHKLIYSGGCEDITNEVISRLNAESAGE